MTLWLNGQVVTLDLLPNDIRSSSFRLYESDDNGLRLLIEVAEDLRSRWLQ